MIRIFTKRILLTILTVVMMAGTNGAWGQVVAWETNGLAGDEATVNASTNNINLNMSTLSRGPGLSPSSLANSFSSTNYTVNGTRANAIDDNMYLQFSISAIAGYKVSLSTLDANFRRSSTGPNIFQWQYSLDGFSTAGVDIGGEISYTGTTSNGNVQSQINLSSISELHNVNGGITITIRLYGWGATAATGTFAIGRLAGDDLAIGGTVEALSSTQTLTVSPSSLTGFSYESGSGPSTSQSFMVSGSNLDPVDAAITITAPANFEVSTDDVDFYDTRTLTASGGTIGSTAIFVRLKSGLAVDAYSGNVSISGGGATTQNVSLSGEVTSPPPPPISINSSIFSYSQDFNSLASSGTGNEWNDNSTLTGWYSNSTVLIAGSGTNIAGGIYSFGSETNPSERALGALSSGNVSPIFGVQFQNNTGSTISLSDILVSYTGEQWRQTANAQALLFSYLISSSLITNFEAGSYTNNGLLSFTVPNTGATGSLDGNATDNQKTFSFIPLNTSGEIAEGEYVMLRWSKSGTTSPGLAIDDFSLALATSASTISDGNWDTETTWTGSEIPTPTSKATVSHDVTLSTEVEVFDLTIEAGKVLTISPSGSLTVHGNLTNSAGPSGLVIKSGGSLVHSTAGVDATMEREIIGTSGWGEEHAAVDWHLISSPVAAQAIAGLWAPTGAGNDYDFFGWKEDETALPWRNQKVPANAISDFIPGLGYLAAYQQSELKAFSGALNSGNVVTNILFGGAATKDWDSHQNGWNLLGNPYPSAIDWSLAHGDQFADNYAYVYNRNKTGGPGYEATTGMIAPNQGFFVNSGSAFEFTFTNAMRTHGASFLKHMEPAQGLTLRLSKGDYYDETRLLVNDMSGYERDRYDALKLFGFHPDVPQVFSTTSDNMRVAINSIPDITEETIIPVGVKIPSTGSYEMALTGLAVRFENSDVYLVDKRTGTEILLSEEESYLFDAEASESDGGESRFELRFRSVAGITGIDESNTEAKARVFVSDNTLHVHVTSSDTSRMLEVYDVSGRLLIQQSLYDGLHHSLPMNLHSGIYLVRIQGQQMNQTERIFVR